MNSWLTFGLFLFVGVGMICMGGINLCKERDDPQGRKVHGITLLLGVLVTAGCVVGGFAS